MSTKTIIYPHSLRLKHILFSPTIKRKFWRKLIFCFFAGVLSGCSTIGTYPLESAGFYSDFRTGQIGSSALKISDLANKHSNSKNSLLLRLEQGAILRADGKFTESNSAFDLAEKIIDEFDSRATVSVRNVSSDASSLVTNLKALPYKGYAYDRILLNTFKALNYLSLGQPDKARVEILRAYERQKEALHRYQSEVENAETKARKNRDHVNQVKKDPRFKRQLDLNYEGMNQLQVYADYVNPLTVYLDGILYLASGRSGSDYERARKDFERVQAMIGPVGFLDEDLRLVEAVINGRNLVPTVYVVFENGLAPVREEVRIDIPLPAKEVSYVGAAFPKLTFQPAAFHRLYISNDRERIAETVILSSMDSIIAQEFQNQLDLVIAKTLLTAGAKAAAQYGLEKNFGEIGRFAGTVFSIATTQADLRTWISLPKQFEFARFPRPDTSSLFLSSENGNVKTKIELPESEITLIYVKAIDRNQINYVHTITLR